MSVCPSAYIRVYPLSVAPDHERARAHARTSHARISMRHMRDHARTSVSARERTSTGAMGAYSAHARKPSSPSVCISDLAGLGDRPARPSRKRVSASGREAETHTRLGTIVGTAAAMQRAPSSPIAADATQTASPHKQNSDKDRVAAHTRLGKSAWQQHHAPGHARRERGKGMGGLRFKLPVTAWAGSARRGIPGLGIQCISYWISSFPENRRPS